MCYIVILSLYFIIIYTYTHVYSARFFKSLNELQLIGMVSEFGSSRRKRKSVERFNLSDSLEV